MSIDGTFRRLVVLSLACCVLGCGQAGPKRYRLEGTVEYEGSPVPAGTIYFDPDASKNNKGPQGFAQIVDGKFDTSKGGLGHVGGPMKVRIVGLAAAPSGQTNDDSPKPGLFPDFVDRVELDAMDSQRGFVIHKDSHTQPDPVATPPQNNGP